MSNSSITQKEINKIIEETKNLKSFKVLNQTDRNSLLCYVKINVKKNFFSMEDIPESSNSSVIIFALYPSSLIRFITAFGLYCSSFVKVA